MNRRSFLGASIGFAATPGIGSRRVPVRMQRLSWAGVKLESEGVTVLIDPIEDVSFFGGRFPGAPVRVESESARRYVVLSHLHSDHYDPTLIRRVLSEEGASGAVVVLDTLADETAAAGPRLRPHRLWEPRSIGPFTLVPLPAVDGFGAEQVAWAFDVGGTKIFHGGDGLWHGRWWDFTRAYGPFDLVFLPINGVRTPGATPSVRVPRTMPPVEAAEAALALGARRVVPIHYGVSIPDVYEETEDAPRIFAEAAAARGVAVEWAAEGAWIAP